MCAGKLALVPVQGAAAGVLLPGAAWGALSESRCQSGV